MSILRVDSITDQLGTGGAALKGKTDGSLFNQADVGYVYTENGSGTAGAGNNANITSFDLPAGVWQISISASMNHNSSVTACWVILSTVSGTAGGDLGSPIDEIRTGPSTPYSGGSYRTYMNLNPPPKNISTTTTFYVNGRTDGTGGQTLAYYLWAARIA